MHAEIIDVLLRMMMQDNILLSSLAKVAVHCAIADVTISSRDLRTLDDSKHAEDGFVTRQNLVNEMRTKIARLENYCSWSLVG
jgi:hypothetical protein